jgi:hypothetical protein
MSLESAFTLRFAKASTLNFILFVSFVPFVAKSDLE